MHPWDVCLQWCNIWMRWPMHWWNDAHGVMHWLWCACHDAWLMVHMLECMLATQKVMQVPTIFVGPNQNPSQHNIQVMENRLPWSRYRGSRYQHAPSGTSIWLQHTRGPRFRRGTIGQWWTPRQGKNIATRIMCMARKEDREPSGTQKSFLRRIGC